MSKFMTGLKHEIKEAIPPFIFFCIAQCVSVPALLAGNACTRFSWVPCRKPAVYSLRSDEFASFSSSMRLAACLLALLASSGFVPAFAQEQASAVNCDPPSSEDSWEEQAREIASRAIPISIKIDVDTDEDPDAKRLEEKKFGEGQRVDTLDVDLYASLRLHAIDAYDITSGTSDSILADGGSRIGATGNWQFSQNWNIFGRLEYGSNLIDTVTSKAQTDSGGNLVPRLYNVKLNSDTLFVRFGKSWSTYYKVAGAADRFSIFGGDAAGIYNAGTDGGATGTGRADGALQTHFFLDFSRWTDIKPIRLNAQYQHGEPIPHSDGLKYESTYSLSTWFETKQNFGIGLAWHNAGIDSSDLNTLSPQGIDGDARALALAFKTYGDRWLASLVLADIENIETTDQNLYFDGMGVELFSQWEFRDRWWLVAGGNWLVPDSHQPLAGDYEIKYTVLGLRFVLDSFKHMLYIEWRDDHGKRTDGLPNKNQLTIGLRWDLG